MAVSRKAGAGTAPGVEGKTPAAARAPKKASAVALPVRAESHVALVRRARKINRILAEVYPDAHCELDFETPFQLLVAVVLSAQCTDVRVNMTTPALFARYPTPDAMAKADPEELERLIRPTGFFRNKAKSLLGLSAQLRERFDGEVPGKLEQLVSLPGVGRKTANVILGNAFGVPGITVDTHFGRLARRFGWTVEDDPVKVEHIVGALFPPAQWTPLSHRMIFHGRRVCHAQRPACGACPVADLCPSRGIGETDPIKAELLLRPASAVEAAALAAARRPAVTAAAERAAKRAEQRAGQPAAAESAAPGPAEAAGSDAVPAARPSPRKRSAPKQPGLPKARRGAEAGSGR